MQAKSGCENGGNSTAQQAKGVTNEGSHTLDTLLKEEIQLWLSITRSKTSELVTGLQELHSTLKLPRLVNAFQECLCVYLGMLDCTYPQSSRKKQECYLIVRT